MRRPRKGIRPTAAEPAPVNESEREDKKLAAIEKESPPSSSEQTAGEAKKTWWELFFLKDYDEAIQVLEEKIAETKSEDETDHSRVLIGYIKQRQDFAAGVEYFEELIAQYPNRSTFYDWHAAGYGRNEMYEECLVILDRGLAAAEDLSKLVDRKADCLAKIGRQEEAVSLLTSRISENPDEKNHYVKITSVLIEVDRQDEAREWFERGLRAFPDYEDLLSAYGRFLFDKMIDREEALIVYKRLTSISPDSHDHWGLLGNTYLELGLNNLAFQAYEKAESLREEKTSWIVGNLYNNRGFYSKAAGYLKEALELDPDSDYVHDRLSSALKNQEKENEKEKEILEKARRKRFSTEAKAKTENKVEAQD